jgi:hypothetical protein
LEARLPHFNKQGQLMNGSRKPKVNREDGLHDAGQDRESRSFFALTAQMYVIKEESRKHTSEITGSDMSFDFKEHCAILSGDFPGVWFD